MTLKHFLFILTFKDAQLLTLAVSSGQAIQGKLAWVILYRELLQQALDDLTDGGGAADV